MNHKELVEFLITNNSFESISINKIEELEGKFYCSIKEITNLSKNGFYLYSCRDADTKELAIEGAVLHLLKTGAFPHVSIVSEVKIKEPKVKKQKKEEKEEKEEIPNETGESSI